MKRTSKSKEPGLCIALDKATCGRPVAEDGQNILCREHMDRLLLGHDVKIIKSVGDASRAALERLNQTVKGSARLMRADQAANARPVGFASSPVDAPPEPTPPNGEGGGTSPPGQGGQGDGNGSGGDKKPEEKQKTIDLIPLAVISGLVTAYGAFVMYLQAPIIQLPLGLTLSGFNATTVILQTLPHALTVLLVSLVVLILLCTLVSIFSGVLWGISWVIGWCLGQIGKGLNITAGALRLRDRIARVFQLHKTKSSELGKFETIVALSIERINVWMSWAGERRATYRARLVDVFKFPYKTLLLGDGNPGAVFGWRISCAVFAVLIGMQLAVLHAHDTERHIYRAVNGTPYCTATDSKDACIGLARHWLLDPIDAFSKNARERVDQTPQFEFLVAQDQGFWDSAGLYLSEIGHELRRVASYVPAKTAFQLRELLAPNPAQGTFVYATKGVATTASHVLANADATTTSSFRTEKLVHIGDYGEWTFVAKASDTKKRMLVRRSALSEFAMASQIGVVNPKPAIPDVPTGISGAEGDPAVSVALSQLVGQNRALRTDLNKMRDDIRSLDSELTKVTSELVEVIKTLPNRDGPVLTFAPVIRNSWGQGGGGDGAFELPDLNDLASHGVAARVPGILEDLRRRYSPNTLANCRAGNRPLYTVEFGKGRADWRRGAPPDGYQALLAELQKMADLFEDGAKTRLVVLEGGASFTGPSDKNLALSEARAKWVKARLLSALFPGETADVVDLAIRAPSELGVEIVAFGMGERMPSEGNSSQAVEVYVCSDPPQDQLADQGGAGAQDLARNE